MKKTTKSIIKSIFILFVIGMILYEGKAELSSINIADVMAVLKSLPAYIMIFFMLGGFLMICISSIHDFIISTEMDNSLSKFKVFKISLIANTLNNMLGGISGAGIRVMIYNKVGINIKEAIYYNIILVASASTGLSALTLLTLLNFKNIHIILQQYEFILVAVIAISLYIPLFFLINKFTWFKKKLLGKYSDRYVNDGLLKKLFAASVLEWTVTAVFFSLISLYFSPGAKFVNIFSVFIIASVIGVISLMPGAIGTFDMTLLLGLSLVDIDSNQAIATLMMFRLFYYILPFIIAIAISIPEFFKKT